MARAMRPRDSVFYRRRPRYLPRRPRRARAVAMRPGRPGYARRRGAGWIPAVIIILLLVGIGLLAWMLLSGNDDGASVSPTPVSTVVALAT
jgi:hypothetical protein